jgi:lipopolysaccharide biosynthesis regulator YciM
LLLKKLLPVIITLGITALLYFFTSIVTPQSVKDKEAAKMVKPGALAITIDTILGALYPKMKPEDAKIAQDLYASLQNQNTNKASVYKQLSSFWQNANVYEPYIHAESNLAQLESSEKKLTFVAHLVLERLLVLNNTKYSNWLAQEAQTLFLKAEAINPNNDSTKVGLGATYMFGNNTNPMEGISKVKSVADRDSSNIFAQYILGVGNTINGMSNVAIQRFINVLRLNPKNVDALLRLGSIYKENGDNKNAIETYKKLLPLATNKQQVEEVEKIISSLKN